MPARAITAVIAHDSTVRAELVADHIPHEAGIELAEVVDTLYPPSETLKSSSADVLVLACADGSGEAIALVSWWHASRPGRPIIVLCSGSSNGFVEEAFA